MSNAGDSGRGVTLALPANITGALVVTASKAPDSASTTLANAEGSVLFSSLLGLKKHTYGFANDQVRAYVELLGVHDIAVTKNDNGDMSYTMPLLAYMVSEKYLPFVNPILAESGICLMNGNFIDHATVSTVCLCGEDRVLFASDIERNRYFA